MKGHAEDDFNSLPNDKFLDWSKWTALNFAYDNINVTEKLKFVVERVEDIVGKGENAEYQQFALFPQCFQKASFSKSGLFGETVAQTVELVFDLKTLWEKEKMLVISIVISIFSFSDIVFKKLLLKPFPHNDTF